jgi:structural maintenance of chromosome 3 (chondroitin sulfate proteoglycan 6)
VKEFNSARQRGEIHFLPLNVLEIQKNNLPQMSGASPLIDQLQWIPKAEKAVRHVFNRIMLCEDFNSATRTARQYDVDCVTLDGDQVQRKGALTGGYIDKKVSRLELQRSIKQIQANLTKSEQEYDKLRNEIMNIDNEHNNIMTELQREDMKSKKNWYEEKKPLNEDDLILFEGIIMNK